MITLANKVNITPSDYAINKIVPLKFGALTHRVVLDDQTHSILFDDDGNVLDIAYNLDSALSIINSTPGTAGYALNPDDQTRLDHEHDLRADCFGN